MNNRRASGAKFITWGEEKISGFSERMRAIKLPVASTHVRQFRSPNLYLPEGFDFWARSTRRQETATDQLVYSSAAA